MNQLEQMTAKVRNAFAMAFHSQVEEIELSTDLNGDTLAVNGGGKVQPALIRTVVGLYGVA